MKNQLMDNMEFIPAASFIAALIFGILRIILSAKQRRKRSLAFSRISETPLLRIDERIENDIQIAYGQEEVENIHLVLLKILNNGNEPILKEDFKEPIILEFNIEAKILDIGIEESNPKNLRVQFERRSYSIAGATPELLNPGEWFTLKLLVSGYRNCEINGHVVGVKNLVEHGSTRLTLGNLLSMVIVALVCVSLAFFLSSMFPEVFDLLPVLSFVLFLLFSLGLGLGTMHVLGLLK